jgi:biopolymer transport protein ExbB
MLNESLIVLFQQFFEQGGNIIPALFLLALILWALIIERFYFIKVTYPKLSQHQLNRWSIRKDKQSWNAHRIRELLISKNNAQLHLWLSSIKVLIAICPLLGLLGTVSGMVTVFDVIAVTGNSNARAMSAGIYKATLPTMVGLCLALSALYFSYSIKQLVMKHSAQFEDKLNVRTNTHPHSQGAL